MAAQKSGAGNDGWLEDCADHLGRGSSTLEELTDIASRQRDPSDTEHPTKISKVLRLRSNEFIDW